MGLQDNVDLVLATAWAAAAYVLLLALSLPGRKEGRCGSLRADVLLGRVDDGDFAEGIKPNPRIVPDCHRPN